MVIHLTTVFLYHHREEGRTTDRNAMVNTL